MRNVINLMKSPVCTFESILSTLRDSLFVFSFNNCVLYKSTVKRQRRKKEYTQLNKWREMIDTEEKPIKAVNKNRLKGQKRSKKNDSFKEAF